ncbi:MAG: DUF2806 domain-containing protein [Deltaproteobacteria bacterium]|nr:DUF2806 domain-containing protein [Deltaproteobacteria bacterium]
MDEHQPDEEADGKIEALVKRLLPAARTLDSVSKSVAAVSRRVFPAGIDCIGELLKKKTSDFQLGRMVNENEIRGMTIESRALDQVVEKQERFEKIVLDAIGHLAKKLERRSTNPDAKGAKTGGREFDYDWFEVFRSEATKRSLGDWREAFVRILAREMETPGTFSIKTLFTLGQLNFGTAQTFKRAAEVSLSLCRKGDDGIRDARLPSSEGRLGQGFLTRYGLAYDDLLVLVEHGLIHEKFTSCGDYRSAITNSRVNSDIICHRGMKWVLVSNKQPTRQPLWVEGAAFTRVGRELFGITEIEPEFEPRQDAIEELRAIFRLKGFEMMELRQWEAFQEDNSPNLRE